MRIAIITDNGIQFTRFKELINSNRFKEHSFIFYKSSESKILKLYETELANLEVIDVKQDVHTLVSNFDLLISLHCKQIFPESLIEHIRCINIHPGFNPLNRGWYPQVFSVIDNSPVGVTIHEMNKGVDSGPIIVRRFLETFQWETSSDIYHRLLLLEMELLKEWLPTLIEGNYTTFTPEFSGKLRTRKEFLSLCEIDLNEKSTNIQLINKLRALSHQQYKNAYFYDPKSGKKIFVSINLEADD